MSSVENLLVVFHKAKLLIFYRIANSGMTVLVILFVQWMDWSFRHYLFLFLLVEIVFTLLTYVFAMLNTGKLHFCFNRELLIKVLKFSLPLGIATAMGTLRMEMDKLFIGFVMDTEKLALYTNAAKELPVTMISASFTAVLLPHIARLQKDNKTEEGVKLWNDVTVLSFIINSMIACGLFVFSKEAVLFLYSEKYYDMRFLKNLVGDEVFNYNDVGGDLYYIAVSPPGKLFKKSLIQDIRFDESLIFEDNPFFIEAFFKAQRVYFHDEYLYYRLRREGSIMTSNASYMDIIPISNKIIDITKKYNHFNEFKDKLFNKKIFSTYYRFTLLEGEIKEKYYNEMKKDLQKHQKEINPLKLTNLNK